MTPLFIQNMGLPGILLICVVALVLFGRGKISNMMGEVGRGITAFKKGVNEASGEEAEAIEDAADAAKDVTPKKKAAKKPAAKTAKKPAKKTTKKS